MGIKLLSIILSFIFLISGGAKLAGLAFEVAAFERWGYSMWFMYLIGAIEVSGGIGLLTFRLSTFSGMSLTLIMIGAVVTHLNQDEVEMLIVSSIILLLTFMRAWIKRDEIKTLTIYKFIKSWLCGGIVYWGSRSVQYYHRSKAAYRRE